MFLFQLEVVRGDKLTRHEFALPEGGKIIVGRIECDLLLEHRTVSRKHLGFAVRKGRLVAGDLKSTSGTRLNGAALKQVHVKKGDVFEVGPYLVRVRRFQPVSQKASAPTGRKSSPTFLIPWVGKGGFHPLAFARFYIAFLKHPGTTWKQIPKELTAQQVFRALPLHALLIVGATALGAPFKPRDGINFGIWWMVVSLALGLGLSHSGLVLFGVRASWGKAMAWVLAASALCFPFALIATLCGLNSGSVLLLGLVPGALAFAGFVRLFKPQALRFWKITASAAAVLALVVGSALWVKSRPTEIERSIANLPPARYEYDSNARSPLTPRQAGLE